ncbi:MAG: hypothetical protein P9M00_07985 [Candidatus Tritonobacter lacicola]|nr:hypothetical protein [Candidatus Tritonobacter lacicola]
MSHKFNIVNRFTPVLAAIFSLICGCARHEVTGGWSYPDRPKGASELRQVINEKAGGARPLKLKGMLTYWAGPDARPRSCRALIIADPSRKLRVKGYRSLGPTLFEAAADGDELLMYTYSTGEFTRPGSSGEGALCRRLLDGALGSLFAPSISDDEIILLECTPKYYILSLAGREESGCNLEKKIWIDNKSLRIAGLVHYDGSGIPIMMATMQDYTKGEPGLSPTPTQITLFWPGDGAVLDISLKSVDRAGSVPPGAFSLSDLPVNK